MFQSIGNILFQKVQSQHELSTGNRGQKLKQKEQI